MSRNKKYWADRAIEVEAYTQTKAGAAAEKIKKAYERAINNIEDDIEETFRAFTRLTGVDDKVARELIDNAQNDAQYEELLFLLDEITDESKQNEIKNRINAQAYGARMNRLEALKQRVYIEMNNAALVEQTVHNTMLSEAINIGYYATIHNVAKGLNCGIDFSVLNKKAIDKVLDTEWLGSNYSNRIWKNNNQFISKLQQSIEDGIIAGHSVEEMAEQLHDFVDAQDGESIRYITERLVRTETAHFMAEGQAAAYEEIGIETYRFLASLSERTCPECGALDGQTFKVSERTPGVNYPVIHPNCRCTTILGDFLPKTRIARDPIDGHNYKVDGSITYEQWRNGLTDEQKDAMELYVKQMRNKSADKAQYDKYKEVLGAKNVPKTFDKFVDLKYNDSEKWALLKDYKNSRSSNMICSFTTFDDYVKYKKRIDDELIGIVTSDGIEIKSQSKHFIERVFGTTEDPHTGRPRSGVEIEDIKSVLLKQGRIISKDNSRKYRNDVCEVSVNPITGTLIQTNPK